jgi:mannose-6-phosphate isomerase-like protein (cupin superfamily)
MNNPSIEHQIHVLDWEGEGFRPLVHGDSWIVALMNWEQRFDRTGLGDIERHLETDEVFVLTQGKSILFAVSEDVIQMFDMEPGVIYNVTKGTWHSVIGTKETTWLIVESSNTSSANTHHRQLTEEERTTLLQRFPEWLAMAGGC